MTIGIGALIQRVSVFRQAVSVGPWNPAQLGASLALWLDADDSSTITLNGSNVAQWDDKSGNGRHVSQATAADQPDYQTIGINGKPAVGWDSSANSKYLKASGVTDYSPQRFFGVADYDGDDPFSGFATVFSHDALTSEDFLRSNNTGVNWVNVNPVFHNGSTTSTTVALPEINTPFVFATDYAQSPSRPNIWIGSDRAVVLRSWKGKISEIISLNVVPSIDIKQKLEGYLAWKWGGIPQERAWAPSDLGADLALWLDADDESTITLNESNVAQWSDKSGNGRNISQAVATNQPSYNTRTLNSKNTIEFSGNQMLFSTASVLSGNPDVLMAVVVQFDTNFNISDDRVVQLSAGSGTSYAISGGTQGYSSRFNNGNEIYGPTSLATPLIQIGTRASGSTYDASQMFINGTESAPTAAGSSEVPVIGNGVSVGAGATGTNPLGSVDAQIDGYIAETVIAEDVTLSTRQRLEGYLAHKWGLTTNLPVDHPYKDAAPTVAI